MIKEYLEVNKMTKEEEYAAIAAAQAGDLDARNRVVEANLGQVFYAAKTFKNQSLSFEDLVQEGTFGLMRAVDDFDLKSNNQFSTYASYWITQKMSRATANKGRSIRLPVYLVESISKFKKAQKKLSYDLKREPTPAEVGKELGIDDATLAAILKNMEQVSSLDTPLGEDGSDTVGSLIEDTSADFSSLLYNEDRAAAISAVLNTLHPKEAQIIKLHFGLEGNTPHTLEQIGKMMNRSREDMRKIEQRGLRKLRHPSRANIIKEFLAYA